MDIEVIIGGVVALVGTGGLAWLTLHYRDKYTQIYNLVSYTVKALEDASLSSDEVKEIIKQLKEIL